MRETHEAGAATGHDVLVTTPSFGQHASGPWEVFEAAGVRARTASAAHPLTERQLIEEAEGVRALVVGLDPVTAAVLDAAPALTVVAKHGVGTDNIDLAAAAAHGVRVVNAPGSNTTAVADMTMALLLAAVRRIVPAHASVTAGRWDRFFGPELVAAPSASSASAGSARRSPAAPGASTWTSSPTIPTSPPPSSPSRGYRP